MLKNGGNILSRKILRNHALIYQLVEHLLYTLSGNNCFCQFQQTLMLLQFLRTGLPALFLFPRFLVFRKILVYDFRVCKIAALAVVLRDFDVSLVKADKDAVTLQFNDNVLAAILEELYFSRGKKDYAEIVETLSLHYGSMQTMNQHLVDYITFRNLMRHEYIYHGLEDDIAVYQDMDGNECYGMDAYTVEKIEKREEAWENMSQAEQSAWYQKYQNRTEKSDDADAVKD